MVDCRRTSAEPYDLTKRSPTESHSKSCSPASSTSIAPSNNPPLAAPFMKGERHERDDVGVNGKHLCILCDVLVECVASLKLDTFIIN